MNLLRFLCVTSVAVVFAVGCSKTNSDNVKTSGFYVTYTVTGNNVGTATCTARLQVGGSTGTFLELNGGDSITCDGQSMSRSEFAGIITYSANVTYAVGKIYTVILNRSGEGSYSSTVDMPPVIAGYTPSTTNSYQKGTIINPTWTPSASGLDTMYVDLSYNYGSGSRTVLHTDTAPENGSGVSFGATDTQVTPAGAPGTWTGTLRYTRSRSGQLSTSLSGAISASQEVSVAVNLTD